MSAARCLFFFLLCVALESSLEIDLIRGAACAVCSPLEENIRSLGETGPERASQIYKRTQATCGYLFTRFDRLCADGLTSIKQTTDHIYWGMSQASFCQSQPFRCEDDDKNMDFTNEDLCIACTEVAEKMYETIELDDGMQDVQEVLMKVCLKVLGTSNKIECSKWKEEALNTMGLLPPRGLCEKLAYCPSSTGDAFIY